MRCASARPVAQSGGGGVSLQEWGVVASCLVFEISHFHGRSASQKISHKYKPTEGPGFPELLIQGLAYARSEPTT